MTEHDQNPMAGHEVDGISELVDWLAEERLLNDGILSKTPLAIGD